MRLTLKYKRCFQSLRIICLDSTHVRHSVCYVHSVCVTIGADFLQNIEFLESRRSAYSDTLSEKETIVVHLKLNIV